MQFISFQKERAGLGHISPSTIANYYKATKLFIEMNIDTPVINWKRFPGVCQGDEKLQMTGRRPSRSFENFQIPDRRNKPIVCTMASSGIRLGAWDFLQWKHVIPLKNEKDQVMAENCRSIRVTRKNTIALSPPRHTIRYWIGKITVQNMARK